MSDNPFRPTAEERRQGYTLLADFAATMMLGPFGPFAVFAARYLYDRRADIFGRDGSPLRAFDAREQPHALSDIASPGRGLGTLAVRPALTDSARRLGLDDGDPVSLVLTGSHFRTARSGLVVPARIGELVRVTVPEDTYSLGAFAGKREDLFSTPHPFTADNGRAVVVSGRSGMVLTLSARKQELRSSGPARPAPPPAAGNRPLFRPGAQEPPPVKTCWWCGREKSACDCVLGDVRRFWNSPL